MASTPTIVLAKLDSNELMKSIDDLVNSVGDKTQKMATQFEKSINIMNDAMKNFAVTQKVSVDLMKEAWKDMSASFAAMVKAQEGEKGGGSKGKAPKTYADNTIGALEQQIKLRQREQKEMVLGTEELRKQNNLIEQQKNLLQSEKRGRMSIKEVLGMDESSLDAIRQKLSALRKVGIDPNNAKQVKLLGDEYARLSIKQKEMMGMNSILYNSNNALARSFNYIRNRIIYAFTVTAVAGFVKELYRVRGEYEMLERSLGVLTNDMRRGSEIFQELNQMALKSPFTLVELGTAAKQLTAYNFAADEVVDTTRRLADISAALGVPMERLVYNLGQIKAQGALTARDARDFANAGLAIVPMLADMYTKQKKFGDELVTTAQVYDMMSKKMVTYSDVMKVINSVTDEGGKFFDYQAKQADTLRVQLANLSLAYNNMLNEIGSEQQDVIELPIKTLRYLYENWRQVASIVKTVAMAYGIYKAAQLSVLALHFAQKTLMSAEAMYKLGVSVRGAITNLKMLGLVIKSNPMGLLASVVAGVASYFLLFEDSIEGATEYTERFGKAGGKVVRETETLFDTISNITKGTSNYKKVLGELNSILEEYGVAQVKESDTIDQINAKRAVAIDLIKQEALERKHLNDIQQGEDTYNKATDEAKKSLRDDLKEAYTGGLFMTQNEELKKNADAISNIIADAVTQNISLIANKTGKEYENGMKRIFGIIQDRMRAIGLSEKTIQDDWVAGMVFNQKNVVLEYVKAIQDAKEAQDAYTEAMNKAFEAEMREAQAHTTVRDRIAATNRVLYNARTDTDKFYNAIDKIIKDFSGQNILDFLVRVKTEVPKWMMNMELKDLARLAARFASLAQNATGSLNVNGKLMTKEELAIRAAQYAQAYKNKQEEEGTNITKAASEALKKYKEALDAVRVAQNLVAQGEKDEAFLKRKQTEEQDAYNKALKAGVSAQELYEAKHGKSGKGSTKKDEFAETVKEEIKVIGEAHKQLEDYRKTMSNTEAIKKVNESYGATFEMLDKKLQKFNTYGLGAGDITSRDLREIRDYYSILLDIAKTRGSEKAIEALDKAWADLGVSISKIDNKRIVESLNSELGKLKEEYELAVALDADPELGDVFASYFGIDKEKLPRDFEQAAKLAQERINKVLEENGYTGTEVDIRKLLDKEAFEQWAQESGLIVDNNLRKAIESFCKYLHDTQVDEIKNQEQAWNALLQKYAEYEYKKAQIQKTAERERKAAQAKGAGRDIIDAINNSERQQLAQLDFEKFQKSYEWIAATGDLAGLTNKALGGLIKTLNEYKKGAKNLDDKQIKRINNALKSLYREQRKENPFALLLNLMDESSERVEEIQRKIDEAQGKIEVLRRRATIGHRELTDEEKKTISNLIEEINKLEQLQKEFGKVSATDVVKAVNSIVGAMSEASSVLGDFFGTISGDRYRNAMKDMQDLVGAFEKAGRAAEVGAKIGGKWGAAIGAVVGLATGLLQMVLQIDQEIVNGAIKESQATVKRYQNQIDALKNSIDELSDAQSRLNALSGYGISMDMRSNYKQQLELLRIQRRETERQIELEKSRLGKYYDKNAIADLEGQLVSLDGTIAEVERSIKNTFSEITDDLLGISRGSWADDLTKSLIEAFRQGEKYMDVFEKSWDEMINNMIATVVSEKVVGFAMEKYLLSPLDSAVEEIERSAHSEKTRLEEFKERVSNGILYAENLKDVGKYDDYMMNAIEQLGLLDEYNKEINKKEPQRIRSYNWRTHQWEDSIQMVNTGGGEQRFFEKYGETIKAYILNGIDNMIDDAALQESTAWVTAVRDIVTNTDIKSKVEDSVKLLDDILADFGIKYGDQSKAELSALQQGISGITEDTASAIEGYMNGISQQVYLHSTLLTQIRDVMVTFDPEVSMGIQSQMLLQLQTQYQLMQSMHSLMSSWTTAAGNGIRVEML